MDPLSGSSRVLDLVVEPRTERYDASDDRWLAQVNELHRALDTEVGGVERRTEPVEGTKGGLDTVILALGSAGAFTAAVEYLRVWLARDRGRSLELSWTIDGRTEQVTVRGDAIDKTALDRIAGAVAARIEEEPWVSPATEPS